MTEPALAVAMPLDPLGLALAFGFGLLAGAAYLASLWVSVRRLGASAAPLPRLLVGAALRIALLVGAILIVMGGEWQLMLAALAGFIVMRIVVTTWARTTLSTSGGGT